MEQTPCPCGGENERCFRCDGTGFYPTRIPGVAEINDLPSAMAAIKAASKRQWRQTPAARQEVRLAHTCSICGKTMPVADELLHRCQKPDVTQPAFKPTGIAPRKVVENLVPAAAKPMVKCPVCGATVKKLEKHRRKAHSKKTQKVVGTRAGRPTQSKRPKAHSGGANLLDRHTAPRETHHDATRGWGHAYRDSGQFGSHPAFDDMGEEGAP